MVLAPAVLAKLREKAERHRELTERLSEPEIAVDHKKAVELIREQGRLTEVARLFGELLQYERRRSEAETLLADGSVEKELRELAREELAGLAREAELLDRAIKDALITDADLQRDKVILEIRAGTGGDEAALFAGDLFRMYQRLCDERGWKLELLSGKPSELGGFKEVVCAVRGERAWRYLR